MRRIDLTGQRFGRLVVLREDPEPYRSPQGVPTRRWRCRCDCGTELVVLQNALTAKKNGTRSCGCAQREAAMAQADDLTGQRFGRLVAVKLVDLNMARPNGLRRGWLCKCDCGREIVTEARNLKTGATTSCGCVHGENLAKGAERLKAKFVDGTSLTHLRSGKPRANNQLGIRGVYWCDREQCYIAHVTIRGRTIKRRCGRSLQQAIKTREGLLEQYVKPILDAHPPEGVK